MITEISINSKNTRAFGWIQDAGSIESLCNVTAVFDSESVFHKRLTEKIIPAVVSESDGRQDMINALNARPVVLKYRMLTGTSFTPRSSSRCNGIIQAAIRGQKRDFIGDWPEEGFVCYPLRSIVAALAETSDKKERAKIFSDWESSSDKYARTIAQWLKQLGLVANCKKEITAGYGQKMYTETIGAFRITPKGERVLRNISGNSKHSKTEKTVFYEMFALKGSDREYRRLRRSLILKTLLENKKTQTISQIRQSLKNSSFEESEETIRDDINGFINLGLNIAEQDDTVMLTDNISDFSIPVYKDLTVKSELSKEKDYIRKQLKNLSHEYLSLMDLAFDPKQNRLFEIKMMDLFLNEYGFFGRHLGGADKPDGIIYTMDDTENNYGIIVDMKAYSGGYTLPITQQDEMKRYISNNQKRNEKINPTKWWTAFPDNISEYYFMFVAGTFKGNISDKLNKIYLETSVQGTAISVAAALLTADKIQSHIISRTDFAKKMNNVLYRL